MTPRADLVLAAPDVETLREICGWDAFRPATFPAAEFPVDVVRFEGSSSRPVVLSRARRAESLKALPASLRTRAEEAFARAERRPTRLRLAHGRVLDFADGPVLMGILNVTPDSFSDGGLFVDRDRAVAHALAMFEAAAGIVDVGGESTRPSNYGEARELSVDEELSRVLPVIVGIRERTDAPLSIDTRRAAVAREAVRAGADLVNDVTAGRFDPGMPAVIAETESGAILMHMKGTDPRTMQDDVRYDHPVADVASSLAESAAKLMEAGVPAESVAVDPGLGFGKSPEGNLVLLHHLAAFRTLGFPLAVGASRKGFVRRFSGVSETASAAERLPGSLAALGSAAASGAAILRVHDVPESARYLRMARAVARSAFSAPTPAGAATR